MSSGGVVACGAMSDLPSSAMVGAAEDGLSFFEDFFSAVVILSVASWYDGSVKRCVFGFQEGESRKRDEKRGGGI